jgi:hypothetical protein
LDAKGVVRRRPEIYIGKCNVCIYLGIPEIDAREHVSWHLWDDRGLNKFSFGEKYKGDGGKARILDLLGI